MNKAIVKTSRVFKVPPNFGRIFTGTVNNEPWLANSVIMLKGVPSGGVSRDTAQMAAIYRQATGAALIPTKGFFRDCTTFTLPVYQSVVGRQFIDSKYYFLIDSPKWKSYIGGRFYPMSLERYIVVKEDDEVVAIVSPLKRPNERL
jgi:hypothetical protein